MVYERPHGDGLALVCEAAVQESALRIAKARPCNSPQIPPSQDCASDYFCEGVRRPPARACGFGLGRKHAADISQRKDIVLMTKIEAIGIPDTKLCREITELKEDIIQAFYDGIKHKPETTFGNVKADVLADKDPQFVRGNFCTVIRGSHWNG
jgi:hypothetical protein